MLPCAADSTRRRRATRSRRPSTSTRRPSSPPRYNIAPTQPIAVVGVQPKTGRRGLASLTWGLVPRASLGGERGFINARAETAWEKPSFREAFARRRCLIPATGFYEWQNTGEKKRQPWLIRMASGGLFAFAGLWEPPAASGTTPTCAILTTEPNDVAREIHDRMPVILDPADYALWLDPEVTVPARSAPAPPPLPRRRDDRLPRDDRRQPPRLRRPVVPHAGLSAVVSRLR